LGNQISLERISREKQSLTTLSPTAKQDSTIYYLRGKEKVIFDIENLSNAYFMNTDTDITGVRFYDKARRRGEKDKADRFKIVNDRLLEDKIEEEDGRTKDFNLGSIKAVYREVLENIMNIE
jgi:hypothetical protein